MLEMYIIIFFSTRVVVAVEGDVDNVEGQQCHC